MANKTMHHAVIGSDTYEIVDEQGRAKAATNTQDITALKEDLEETENELKSALKTQQLVYMNGTNKFENIHYTNGAYRYYESGQIRSKSDYSYSDYALIVPGAYCTISNTENPHITFYDEEFNYLSGSLALSFRIPLNAVYMIISLPIADQSSVVVQWDDNRLSVNQVIIKDATALTDFDDAEWNRIYSFNIVNNSSWDSISHYPAKLNGTLITIDTDDSHYSARQIYISTVGSLFIRYYVPATSSFSPWNNGFSRSDVTFVSESSELPDFNGADWNRWFVLHMANSKLANVVNKPISENGILLTFDTSSQHYAGKQIYIATSGELFTRYYIPSTSSFTAWESAKSTASKKVGVLYNEFLTSSNASQFVGTFTASSDGFTITDSSIFGRFYSIENRTVSYLCKVFSDSVANFCTAPYTNVNATNTSLVVDVVNKTVRLNSFPAESCSFLAGNHVITVELSKRYQKLGIKITDMMTGDVFEKEYINNGTGGAGEGAIGTANNVPMQYDYYGCKKVSGTAILWEKLTVKCDIADVVCYGDSITEQEAYWPTDIFDKTWTQMLINESSQKVVTSGRSGSTIAKVIERIKHELPYLDAKYCVITIGTNGGDTVSNLTELIEYIKGIGVIPILNHIPCYNNNGDTTGYKAVNTIIDTVRANTGVKGCNFDICTSVNYDGDSLNADMMWLETYSGGAVYRHHPNVYGSAAMLAQLKLDVPEIF